jgi:hypothetical protein
MTEHLTRDTRGATDELSIEHSPAPHRTRVPATRRGIASVVALILVGAVIGYLLGYEEYSSRSTKAITPAACTPPASSTTSARFTGTVRAASSRTLVVQESASTNVSVGLEAVTVCRAVGARVDDLRPGQRVTVVGARDAGGAVTAQQVTVTNETRTSSR